MNFSYQIGVNGGYSKNEVIFLDEPPNVLPWQTVTGRPYNDPTRLAGNLMYNAIGVFRDQAAVDAYPHWPGARAGDIIFEDVNKDGTINSDDRIRLENNTIPRFQGGFTLDIQYKGFDFNVLFKVRREPDPTSERSLGTLVTTFPILPMAVGPLKIPAQRNQEPLTGKMNIGFRRPTLIGTEIRTMSV